MPKIVSTSYTSVDIPIPSSFLAPLADASVISSKVIDFAATLLPEYQNLYAVVLDNVLSQQECEEFIHLAERSAGAHGETNEVEGNGWRPAMVNAGIGREFLMLDYRNSDRIIWDEREVVGRLWQRVLQGEGMREYFKVLDGEKYLDVMGDWYVRKGERWVSTKQGELNP
jgi:hypothetical protein